MLTTLGWIRDLAPFGAPFFWLYRQLRGARRIGLCLTLLALAAPPASAEALQQHAIAADYPLVREMLLEAIASEGLVPAPPLPFADMLARTGPSLGKPASPYLHAEIFPFCSAGLAWATVERDPAALAHCPLTLALYVSRSEPEQVRLVYRRPTDPAALALLERISRRTLHLSRLR
ncbi:MAG: hypothetical protein RIR00_585 [Pseudomonadota bacterium]|jgi:hypothetical protein